MPGSSNCAKSPPTTNSFHTTTPTTMYNSRPSDVGIVAMELYVPNLFVDQSELEKYDEVGSGKYTIGLGQGEMGFVGDNEDVNSLCLTAVSRLMSRQGFKSSDFGRLEVGTESILDRSKGVKTVLMQLFEENTELEGIDNVTACYGGTAALFNTVNWIESSSWDGRLGLVVAADVAIYAEGNARPTGGAGAVAMVVGPDAALVMDRGLRGTHMKHVYDFYKPQLHSEYPKVDGPLSIECYLSALDTCYARYRSKCSKVSQYTSGVHSDSGDAHGPAAPVTLDSFQGLLFHTPFCKIVQKSLGRLALSDYLEEPDGQQEYLPLKDFPDVTLSNSYHNKDLEKCLVGVSRDLFASKTHPSLRIARRVGNMYTPSLYGCLAAYITSKPVEQLLSNRIAMFSYGSGMAATMYSLTVSGNEEKVSRLVKHLENLDQVLDCRVKVTPADYVAELKCREETHDGPPGWIPKCGIEYLQPHTYYLTHTDKLYRRHYTCHQPAN